ncbi:MAG: DUF4476 domain-containing protein [Bacteroidota bacterium]
MNLFKQFLLLVLFTFTFSAGICFRVKAQGFSYVYIQGDKKTPIYTKVEGVMMPRYGKNYALLSRLAPGPLNVEVLFQQNEFPAIQFNILVPENGKRAFILQKKDDGFALYDIEQNFYLKANNDIADDHIPTIINNTNLIVEKAHEPVAELTTKETNAEVNIEKVEPKETTLPAKIDSPQVAANTTPDVEIVKTNTEAEPVKTDSSTVVSTDTVKPKFIENITFDNSAHIASSTDETIKTNEHSSTELKTEEANPVILNSDCNGQISALNYTKLTNSITAKKSENERLGLILDAAKQNCMSSGQAQKLIEKLDSDIARFSALKSVYPKITDQANFGSLESLLSDEEWKAYFQNLIQVK